MPSRLFLLVVLSLSGFVTSFGAHIVATNLPAYAETVGAGAFSIGLLIAVYDFAELFAKPAAGFLADRRGMRITLLGGLAVFVLGAAVGAAQSFKEVGDMLGPLAIGAITQTWNVRVGFYACGAAALAVVGLLALRPPRVPLAPPAKVP